MIEIKDIFPDIPEGPLWIFTADRRLTIQDEKAIDVNLSQFFVQWSAHGIPVVAEHVIFDHTVIIIAADSTKSDVSGCGKDKLFHLFMALGKELGINFLNRMLVPILKDDSINLANWSEISEQVNRDEFKETDLYIDATVASVKAWRAEGVKPLSELLVLL